MTNSKATYEIVSGTRVAPGQVLRTFSGAYKCGGPATACLKEFDRMKRANPAAVIFFRKAA